MDIKVPYLQAMREQAPQLFKQLSKDGTLLEHAQEISVEAHRLFEEMTRDAPKDATGYPQQPYAREAEEQIFALLIDFPGPETTDEEDELDYLLNKRLT